MPMTQDKKLTKEEILARSNIESQDIIEKILSAKTAVVTAHVNPDGDTLGSMLALADVLEQAGLERVDRIMHDPVPAIYTFFPGQEKVLCAQKDEDLEKCLDNYDLSFSCDCGSIKRLGKAGNVWVKAQTKCNIDHHLSNPLYGDLNWVDPDATCTGQVVRYIAEALTAKAKEIQTSKELASLYYITLLTDTGGFRHSNTNESVFTWAQKLVSQGADPSILYNKLFNQMPFRAIKIIGDALAKLKLETLKLNDSSEIQIACTYTTQATLDELGALDEDTDEIVDHIMRVKDLDMCLYLREDLNRNEFKGSLRSSTSKIDCSKIASQVNGGGHARAAGFNVPAQSFDDLKLKVFDLIKSI